MPGTPRPNLGLTTGWTYLEDGWHTGMETNLRKLDTLTQLQVKSKTTVAPPGSPSDGDRYIIPDSGGSGDWFLVSPKYIVVWEAGLAAWTPHTPKEGWRVHVADEGCSYMYTTPVGGTAQWRKEGDFYNVLDFSSVAAALAAVPQDAHLYFPQRAGGYTPPDANGWTITKAITIFSDGATTSEDENFLPFKSGGNWKDSVIFRIADAAIGQITFRDCTFSSGSGQPTDPTGVGTGAAVKWEGTANTIGEVRFERVHILYMGGYGVYFKPTGQFCVNFIMDGCSIYKCGRDGLHLVNCTMLGLRNTSFVRHYERMVYLEAIGNGHILSCDFSPDNDTANMTPAWSGTLYMASCAGVTIAGCNFEEFRLANVPTALSLENCRGIVVVGNEFDNGDSVANSIGIYILSASQGNTIGSNNFSLVDIAVNLATSPGEGNIIFPPAVYAATATAKCRLVVPASHRNFIMRHNEDPSTGIATSDGVGIMLPHCPGTASVGSTVAKLGLLIFDSTAATGQMLKYWDGSAWRTVTAT